jgi:translation initiation factor IF-3
MKEIKFRVNIGAHDYETKLRHAEEFLDKGNKVRMLLQFRGREMAHQELGMGVMAKIRKDLESMGHPESEPKLIGRNIFMTVVPLPPGKRKRHFYGPHDMVLKDVPEEGDEEEDDSVEERAEES